jgi:hypothetical protein
MEKMFQNRSWDFLRHDSEKFTVYIEIGWLLRFAEWLPFRPDEQVSTNAQLKRPTFRQFTTCNLQRAINIGASVSAQLHQLIAALINIWHIENPSLCKSASQKRFHVFLCCCYEYVILSDDIQGEINPGFFIPFFFCNSSNYAHQEISKLYSCR